MINLVDFLFPKLCYICFKKGSYICNDCFREYVKINWTQKCHICGQETRLGMVHTECKENSYLDGLIYMSNFEGIAKSLIHDGKYKLYYTIYNDLAEILGNYLKIYKIPAGSILTSVPLHKSKKSKRGFNQADLLAKKLGKKLNLEYKELLKREKNTKTQVAFDKSEREQNLRGAFSLLSSNSLDEKTRSIYIVDDVFTTGTTLNECARVLKEAGFNLVYGITIARTGG